MRAPPKTASSKTRSVIRLDVQPGSSVMVPGDIHGGIHDGAVLEILARIARRERVEQLLLIGDTHHCAGVSPHPKRAGEWLGTLAEEDESVAPYIQAIRESTTTGRATALQGNHEDWVYQTIDKNPGLHRTLEWWTPFPLTYRGVRCLPRDAMARGGSLIYDHGNHLLGSTGKHPAAGVLAAYPGQCTLFGHSHQQDEDTTPTQKHGRQVLHGASTIGHCSIAYLHKYGLRFIHRWQQGGAIVRYFDLGGGKLGHHIEMLRVLRDRRDRPLIWYRGRTYRP